MSGIALGRATMAEEDQARALKPRYTVVVHGKIFQNSNEVKADKYRCSQVRPTAVHFEL